MTDIVERLRAFETEASLFKSQHATVRQAVALIASQARRIEELEGAATDALASLVAAVSLLARGGKRAAPSDKMFAVMLADYNASIDRARATLKGET